MATVPAIDHVEGVRLGEIAYDRLTSMFEGLALEDGAKATDCTGWTVRHLAGHMVGAMRAAASVRELASQQREVRRRMKQGVGEGGDEIETDPIAFCRAISRRTDGAGLLTQEVPF